MFFVPFAADERRFFCHSQTPGAGARPRLQKRKRRGIFPRRDQFEIQRSVFRAR